MWEEVTSRSGRRVCGFSDGCRRARAATGEAICPNQPRQRQQRNPQGSISDRTASNRSAAVAK